MNKYLNIIPTPKKIEYTKGDALIIKTVHVHAEMTPQMEHALNMLKGDSGCVITEIGNADVILYDNIESIPEGILSAEDIGTFENRFAADQGYVIKKDLNSPIYIAAKSNRGCIYGIMTLLQLLDKNVGTLTIYDWPDFQGRSIKWLIWAETGILSYDFGDGVEALKERCLRKLDTLMRYKITGVSVNSYGFASERFPGYNDMMRFINDNARIRCINTGGGGYSMGYGMVGYSNTYQGKDFLNRKSYPDGEVYECIGTYDPFKFVTDRSVDRSVRSTKVFAREHGTCMSNDALTEEKLKEIKEYIKNTHPSTISFHNMDSHEIHPELWLARCENCRKKWPNDDLFAEDGCAGAFAYYIDKLLDGIQSVKDGDYDAARDLGVGMASPGYLYAEVTEDEDFDIGVKFWVKIREYMKNNGKFSTGFREQYFYHNKPVRRTETLAKYIDETNQRFRCGMGFFSGGDGFYDDKLFSATGVLMYMFKGVFGVTNHNGNAFQEPQQLFNAEYMWNSENSGFYNIDPKPENYEEFLKVLDDLIHSTVDPEELTGDGGMLDVICEKLYGKIGSKLAQVYKLRGKNGEQPIPCASSVDIYTNFTKIIFPMRWDNEQITDKQISDMTERFCQCNIVTEKAFNIMKKVVEIYDGDEKQKNDFIWLCECFEMGTKLTGLLHKYMLIYSELHKDLAAPGAEERIHILRKEITDYIAWVDASPRKPVDKFGGSLVRRRDIGEHLDYWTQIMLSSIKQGKRIPDDVRPLPTKNWW